MEKQNKTNRLPATETPLEGGETNTHRGPSSLLKTRGKPAKGALLGIWVSYCCRMMDDVDAPLGHAGTRPGSPQGFSIARGLWSFTCPGGSSPSSFLSCPPLLSLLPPLFLLPLVSRLCPCSLSSPLPPVLHVPHTPLLASLLPLASQVPHLPLPSQSHFFCPYSGKRGSSQASPGFQGSTGGLCSPLGLPICS